MKGSDFLMGLLSLACIAAPIKAQQLSPAEIYSAKVKSSELTQRGQPDSALALLRRITALDSADATLWRRYGRLAAQKNLRQEAIAALQHTFRLGAFNRAITALEIAKLYAAEGRPTNALNWLERAAENRLQHPERLVDDSAFAALRDSARMTALYSRANSETLSRDDKWRRDIDFFGNEARRMHVHPDRPAFSREFTDSIASLKARVSQSTDMQVKLGLRRLVAMLGDGHSAMQRDTSMRMLPIDLYMFADGIYVVNGVAESARLAGSRVVRLGKTPVEDVARRLAALIPHDNDMDLRARLPNALVNTTFLADAGVANADGTVDVTLEDSAGRRSVVPMTGGPLRSNPGLTTRTTGAQPLYRDRSRPYWARDLPEARAVYLNFNSVTEVESLTIARFSQGLAAQLRNPSYRNLIVDVRLNGGGNSFLLPPLIQAIASFAVADTARRVYVITSRHTFSAAQNFAGKLEWLINPVFVGEPTGSAPNFTGELTSTVLPYSGISVTISNRLHMNSDWEDRRQWIAPHVPVRLTSSDFFAGRDPALETVVVLTKH
jgi:tetratricopeptide (TPR) repeat protein